MSLAHATGARRDGRNERGAVLVELALAAPLLLVLLFGIIDFGWAFTQDLDVKQGAREGSRLVAVNYRPTTATGDPQADAIIDEVCRRMDGSSSTTITVQIPGGQSGSIGAVGQYATVTVDRPATSLSGLFSPVLSGKTLHSRVETRLEVKATWASTNTARSKSCS